MSEPYIYRILKTSWGIWIRINCEIQALSSSEEMEIIKINDKLHLSIALQARGVPDDVTPYFIKGVELVAEELQKHLRVSTLIHVTECTVVITDYQPEGLTYAIAGWLTREYGLNWKPDEVIYNKETNHYIFPFTL
jgi:hypothetical protein